MYTTHLVYILFLDLYACWVILGDREHESMLKVHVSASGAKFEVNVMRESSPRFRGVSNQFVGGVTGGLWCGSLWPVSTWTSPHAVILKRWPPERLSFLSMHSFYTSTKTSLNDGEMVWSITACFSL